MPTYLVDTTVLIDALRGYPAAERIRALRGRHQIPYVCAVNIEEVWRGAKPQEESAVRRLFGGLRVAPLGRVQGEMAGRWRRAHATRGLTLHQADCLVAAAAVGVDAILATGNPDDFPMEELRVEHWPVGV